MVITYYGAACFKVQAGETVLAFAPPSKDSKFKSPRFGADIVLVNNQHPDYNGWENLSSKDEKKPPFVIDGAGEYEVAGIYIKGISLPPVYVVNFEDIVLCHLTDPDEKKITPEIKEQIGEIDILFAPAPEFINLIEPKIAIVPNYKGISPSEKLTIKKKDLSAGKTQVVVLAPAI
jgi:hypothetical protein